MTKVSVFGQETEKKKPIEFVKWLDFFYQNQNLKESTSIEDQPKEWDNVTLLQKEYHDSKYDLIFATDDNGTHCLFLGHWNDGFVE